jgi:hypothetical protein
MVFVLMLLRPSAIGRDGGLLVSVLRLLIYAIGFFPQCLSFAPLFAPIFASLQIAEEFVTYQIRNPLAEMVFLPVPRPTYLHHPRRD